MPITDATKLPLSQVVVNVGLILHCNYGWTLSELLVFFEMHFVKKGVGGDCPGAADNRPLVLHTR